MRKMRGKITRTCTALVCAGCLAVGAVAPAQGSGLNGAEADGYLQWLHSLEVTILARAEAGLTEGNLLFPFDNPGHAVGAAQPYRHLAISRALGQLESEVGDNPESKIKNPFEAYCQARNYANLTEYASALQWYDLAARLDTLGSYRREIGQERLAVGIAGADSLTVARLLTNTLGLSEIVGREEEIILAYRFLLTNQDTDTVALLVQKIEGQQAVLGDRLRYWHAFAMSWLGDTAGSLRNLRKLVCSGGLSRDLTENQRAWVVLSLPDLFFLTGDKDQARDLYRLLAGARVDQLRLWGEYQQASLAFLECDFLGASTGFQKVCEAKGQIPWQDHCCQMATLATELSRIKREGEPYGTTAFYGP